MKKTRRRIQRMLMLIWLIPCFSGAQSADLWWLQGSAADTVTSFRTHASGSLSYSRMQGVLSGKTTIGELKLVVRKSIFTNFTRYGIDQMSLNLKSQFHLNYAATTHYFTDYLNIDLSRIFFCEVGYIWERDDVLLVQNRYTLYGGPGLRISTKRFNIKSLAALGRINQEYMIPVDQINVVKGPNSAFYTIHEGSYNILPQVSLTGRVFYYTGLENTDRYRYGYHLNLSVGLSNYLNLILGYNFRHDKELVLLGLQPDNSSQHVGIEVSL